MLPTLAPVKNNLCKTKFHTNRIFLWRKFKPNDCFLDIKIPSLNISLSKVDELLFIHLIWLLASLTFVLRHRALNLPPPPLLKHFFYLTPFFLSSTVSRIANFLPNLLYFGRTNIKSRNFTMEGKKVPSHLKQFLVINQRHSLCSYLLVPGI